MKIIVVGCGKIGTAIISGLVNEGHDVVAIDNSPAIINDTSNMYDVICVQGNGADYDTLLQADANDADVVIAVTGSDEFNMLSCFIAKRMGTKHTIARIRNPEYNDKNSVFMKKQLELSLSINPEFSAAQEIFNLLKLPTALNIETFSRRNFKLVEILLKADSKLDGMNLMSIRKKYSGKYLICVVQRGEEVFIPDGSFVLKDGDRIAVTAEPAEIHKFLKNLSIMQKSAKNVMILGASKTAYYLAKMLIASGNSVKVIDLNQRVCEEFSASLPEALVVNGDGAEQEVLFEEGISDTDAFVSLTGMDEENILISVFASSQNVPKVITKVNRKELGAMATKLGLDSVISPKNIVADEVLSYVRAVRNSLGSNVETLYKIMDNKAEAVEFNVQQDFKFAGVSIKDMKFKDNILIAGILRGRRAIIPSGDDIFLPDDKVIVIAAGKQLNDLSDIFE